MAPALIQPAMYIIQPFGDIDGKMVQIYIDEVPLLGVCSSMKKHSALLEDLLQQHQVPFLTEKFIGGTRPIPNGERYRLIGAGSIIIYNSKRSIDLFSFSTTYEIGPHQQHAEEFLAAMKQIGPWEYDRIECS